MPEKPIKDLWKPYWGGKTAPKVCWTGHPNLDQKIIEAAIEEGVDPNDKTSLGKLIQVINTKPENQITKFGGQSPI